MSTFRYKAVTAQGELVEGIFECPSRDDVVGMIREAGQIPLDIQESRPGGIGNWLRLASLRKSGADQKVVLAFTQELSSLLDADIPLDRCLGILRETQDDPVAGRLVLDIQDSVRSGKSLSAAMEARTGVFSPFYLSMVKTAEASGELAAGLKRLTEYLERSKALRERVISALIYPAVLFGVAMLSLLLILTYVVPQFASMFEQMGGALPWSTRVVLGLSEFAQSYGVLALIVLALAALAAKRVLSGPGWARRLDSFRMRLPLVGALVVKVEVARFSRSLGTLLQGGVPMIRSLETASSSMNSPSLRQAVEKAADGVSQGRRLVDPLIESGRFPRLALQMIKVGEETGNLGAMLMKVANVYDEEVAVSTQRMLALLEPLLIVVLGVMVAMIVLSVLLGITSVTDVPL